VALSDGRVVTAHVPNTGSMATCWRPGAPVQLTHSDNPRRKLAWTLERVDMGQGWIGVHTARPNLVMAEAIAAGRVPALAGYRTVRTEVRFAADTGEQGRLDIALGDGGGPDGCPRSPDVLVEVKNVTLLEGARLCFPDARSERARKHLGLLAGAVRQGLRGVMLFALNRPEGEVFAPAWEIDPAYAEALRAAAAAGVEIIALRMVHEPGAIVTGAPVPVDLAPPIAQ
jgi:sugar fermentation stimulation protein A